MNQRDIYQERGYTRVNLLNLETYEKRMTDKDGTIFYIRIFNNDPLQLNPEKNWIAVAYFTSVDGVDFEVKIDASNQSVRYVEAFFTQAYYMLGCVPRFDALAI